VFSTHKRFAIPLLWVDIVSGRHIQFTHTFTKSRSSQLRSAKPPPPEIYMFPRLRAHLFHNTKRIFMWSVFFIVLGLVVWHYRSSLLALPHKEWLFGGMLVLVGIVQISTTMMPAKLSSAQLHAEETRIGVRVPDFGCG
jgi:hypothetical protein